MYRISCIRAGVSKLLSGESLNDLLIEAPNESAILVNDGQSFYKDENGKVWTPDRQPVNLA